MTDATEYPQDAKPVKNRRELKIVLASIVAAVVIVALSWGGVAWANGISAQRAHVEAVALQHQVEQAKPRLEAQTQAAADEADTSTADDVVAAEKQREAEAAAAQAAEAAAQEAAAQTHKASSGFGGNAPAGTPIPMHRDTDPNSGSYGQMVIENPDQFCASNGGTTRSDGVAVCS